MYARMRCDANYSIEADAEPKDVLPERLGCVSSVSMRMLT